MGPGMADGSPKMFRKRSMMSYTEDADPRFSTDTNGAGEGKRHRLSDEKKKPAAKVAFTGEEWGFGYQATATFLETARNRKTVPDAGFGAIDNVRVEREFEEASKNNAFDYQNPITQPLRTKEQALMAVQQGTADFALVPFYNPYAGYDYEALRAVASLNRLRGIQQIEATDHFCLAVHESQLYDIVQSSHPGTGFSSLQRRLRKSWGVVDSDSGNRPGDDYNGETPRAGLPIDMADQKLIRDRIDVVFAGPEAARRCKSKLDGLRSIGVETKEMPQTIEPHRELAKLARSTINTARQTNTVFDPITGDTRHFSSLGADAQNGSLFAMALPYEVAMRSSDYVIIDHNIDDAPPLKTRFMVVENNPDHSLYEDKYRTTDAKTKYWTRRLAAVANPNGAFGQGFLNMFGYFAGLAAFVFIALGFYGVSVSSFGLTDLPPALAWLSSLTSAGSMVLGVGLALAAYMLLSVQATGSRGVRAMFLFRRDKTAAAIGDIENFLRNFGVRHTVVRIDEDSEANAPASIVLDVEFFPEDFSYGPIKAITHRLRGSVVNGALKKAFQRWKNRGVTLLAVMPFEPAQAQLPKHKARRWWSEALNAWAADFTETMFIRFSRVLFFYGLPTLLVGYLIWKMVLNG